MKLAIVTQNAQYATLEFKMKKSFDKTSEKLEIFKPQHIHTRNYKPDDLKFINELEFKDIIKYYNNEDECNYVFYINDPDNDDTNDQVLFFIRVFTNGDKKIFMYLNKAYDQKISRSNFVDFDIRHIDFIWSVDSNSSISYILRDTSILNK